VAAVVVRGGGQSVSLNAIVVPQFLACLSVQSAEVTVQYPGSRRPGRILQVLPFYKERHTQAVVKCPSCVMYCPSLRAVAFHGVCSSSCSGYAAAVYVFLYRCMMHGIGDY